MAPLLTLCLWLVGAYVNPLPSESRYSLLHPRQTRPDVGDQGKEYGADLPCEPNTHGGRGCARAARYDCLLQFWRWEASDIVHTRIGVSSTRVFCMP